MNGEQKAADADNGGNNMEGFYNAHNWQHAFMIKLTSSIMLPFLTRLNTIPCSLSTALRISLALSPLSTIDVVIRSAIVRNVTWV